MAVAALVVLTAGISGSAVVPNDAADSSSEETVGKVRKALERLPYYGVFDFLVFSVDEGTVTLQGYAHRPALKREAEDMVRKATGAEIANQIEVLPTSPLDDRIRWDTYLRVYSDEFSSRYVSGGPIEVRYEAMAMARFPGMEPYGNYPVHIIVKRRQVSLLGVVDSEFDKTVLLLHARGVSHASGVDDHVMIRTR
jgi:hyperosmotically inducible protein